nr:copia protein [Tanacetum cinerariifolium]
MLVIKRFSERKKVFRERKMTEKSVQIEESIDNAFASFNTIITSLKALDEGFSSKNYVIKFLRVLHPKWRAKVTAIKESKDLTSLTLDEHIGNLKVYEAKKESSDEESLTFRSEDEEYAMAVRDFKKFFKRRGRFMQRSKSPHQRIPETTKKQNQKAFVEGSWSNSGEYEEEKIKDETCLMAQVSNETRLEMMLDDKNRLDDVVGSQKCGFNGFRKVQIRAESLARILSDALKDKSLVVAMQEELNQFIVNDVWVLVPCAKSMIVTGTKCVFRNKLDENGIVSRNKAKLVAQGYNQQDGIDYDKAYAPVSR